MKTFPLLTLFPIALLTTAALADSVIHLEDDAAVLRFEASADKPLSGRSGEFQIAPDHLWGLVLQQPGKPWAAGPQQVVVSKGQTLHASATDRELTVVTDGLTTATGTIPIRVELKITLQSGGWVGSLAVSNRSTDWIVRDVRFSAFGGITSPADRNYEVLWPNGLGQRFASPTEFGARSFSYPSGTGTMQWIAFAGGADGLYLGVHDGNRTAKEFRLNWPERSRFDPAISHLTFAGPGESASTAPVVLRSYQGSWHHAARTYRAWFDTAIPMSPQPAWAKSRTGWLLAVMKQQNGEVLWGYHDIDLLCDIADQRGLDTLGLFGWAHGGHDRFFPEFAPDPLMGGPAALKAALARARARGKKTILYANGIMMDVTTGFYAQHGNEVALLRDNRELNLLSVRKFHSSPPVPFALACAGAELWQERMLHLALQAQRLGADGILFDQLGTGGGGICFADHHAHGPYGTPTGPLRFPMVRAIAARVREVDPNFIIATEGMTDGLLESVGYFHGWGTGFTRERAPDAQTADMFPRGNDYPALLRYTFPEWPGTIRHPTPGLDAAHANHAILLGLGLEIEGRYRADKLYLERNVVPDGEAYADVTYYPPDYRLLASLPPHRAAEISARTAALRRRHAEFLMEGRFRDVDGIELTGSGVVAAVFAAASGHRAVVLVNQTAAPQAFTLKTEFGAPVTADNIDQNAIDPHAVLAPFECRVLRFATPSPQSE